MFKGQCLTLFLKKMATIENTDKTTANNNTCLSMEIAAIKCPSATHPLCPFDHQLAIQRASSKWETQSTIVGNAVSGSFFQFRSKTVRKFC